MIRNTPPAKKQKSLSLAEKLRIIQEVENNPGESRSVVAARLGLPVTTLKTIYQKREEIRNNISKAGASGTSRQRNRDGKFGDLENALFEWFRQQRTAKVPISGPILLERAREIARMMNITNFKASNGWLSKFKSRHGISGRTISDDADSVNNETIEEWLNSRLPDVTKNYALRDIYNLDETGLFYNMLPDKTLAQKGESCRDGKRSKQRLTVLLGVNANGSDKLPPLVIGKSKKPRCFKNVKTLPTRYKAHRKAWMTGELFEKYLRKLDDRMGKEKRKILVVVDNCAAHPKELKFKNMKVTFFPANCTSCLQFLDLGIIACFKASYRTQLVRLTIASLQDGPSNSTVADYQIDVLQAMHLIASADTIIKCFRKGGVAEEVAEYSDLDDDEAGSDMEGEEQRRPLPLNAELLERPVGWDRLSNGMPFEDFLRCDDNLVTAGQQSLEDIVSNVTGDDGSDEDEGEDVDVSIPSFAVALSGYNDAKIFLCSKETSEKDMRVVSNFQSLLYKYHFQSQKQSTIEDYFKP